MIFAQRGQLTEGPNMIWTIICSVHLGELHKTGPYVLWLKDGLKDQPETSHSRTVVFRIGHYLY